MDKPGDRGPDISPRRDGDGGQNARATEQYAHFRDIFPSFPSRISGPMPIGRIIASAMFTPCSLHGLR